MVFYDSAVIYTSILSPFKEDILKINTTLRTNPEKAEKILEKAKGHIQEFLECGLSDIDNPSNMSTYSNDGYFFRHKSLSKVLLVEMGGVEPPSESTLTGTSPGADGHLYSLTCAQAVMLTGSVASLCVVRSKLCALTGTTDRRSVSGRGPPEGNAR